MSLAFISMELLWRNALGAIPLAVAVALICRCVRCRPCTRHVLWLIVLVSLLAPPWLSLVDSSALLASIRAPLAVSAPRATNPSIHREPMPPVAVEMRQSVASHGEDAWSRPNAGTVDSTIPTSPAQSDFEPGGIESDLSGVDLTLACEASQTIHDLPTACGGDGEPSAAAPPQVFSTSIEPSPVTAADPVKPGSEVREEPSRARSASSAWQAWLVQLLALRDAIARLTPLPTSVWLVGSVLVFAVMAGRIVRFRRLLRSAEPASRAIVAQVQEASQAIGLKSTPTVMMTNRKISPLVWCCRRRVLLLPEGLWEELDEAGRRAVLLHELAHLKRRDHLICWLEMIISCLYWWHPLVWWVRRRLRDEADFACDAWVTALLPGNRRAYAAALLTTRQYVCEYSNAAPAVGLGVATAGAKRFARRLTMVMTERSGPRLSIMGSALALCLGVAGWLGAPLLACPPTEESVPSQSVQHKAKLELEKALSKARKQGDGKTTYEAHMADREAHPHPHPNPEDLRGRIDHLEQRLDRIAEHLEKLLGSPRSDKHDQHGAPLPVTVAPRFRQQGPATVYGQVAGVPAAPVPPVATVPPVPRVPAAPPVARGGAVFQPGVPMADDGQTVTRLYRLPEGKREDFTKFMSRADVPILVSPTPEGINVQATPRQHEVIRGFIDIIHPEGAGQPHSRLDQHAPEAGQLTALARIYETRARQAAQQGNLDQADSMLRNSQVQGEIRRQMETMRRQSEQFRKRAAELQLRSQELQSKAQQLSESAEQYQIRAQADAIAAEAEALIEAAEVQDEQAESFDEAIESIRDEVIDAIEEAREEAEEALEAEEEAVAEDLVEEVEEAD